MKCSFRYLKKYRLKHQSHHRNGKHNKRHHKSHRKYTTQILNILKKLGICSKSKSISQDILTIFRQETSSSQIVSNPLPASNPNNTLRAYKIGSNYIIKKIYY